MHALDRLDPVRHRNRHDQRRWHGPHRAHASGCCVRRPLGCDRTWLSRGCAARRRTLRDLVRCPACPLACVQPFIRESCCVCKRHQPAPVSRHAPWRVRVGQRTLSCRPLPSPPCCAALEGVGPSALPPPRTLPRPGRSGSSASPTPWAPARPRPRWWPTPSTTAPTRSPRSRP